MTTSVLLRYIALGLLIKVGSLVFLKQYEDSSTVVALLYGLLLVGLLIMRPLRNKNSFL